MVIITLENNKFRKANTKWQGLQLGLQREIL